MTITAEQEHAIRAQLARTTLITGGSPWYLPPPFDVPPNRMCSMQVLNFAVCGVAYDRPLPGMSVVLRTFIVRVNDHCSDEFRNSAQWRELIVQAAKSSDQHEDARMQIAFDPYLWMSLALNERRVVEAMQRMLAFDVPPCPEPLHTRELMHRVHILPASAGWSAQVQDQHDDDAARTPVLAATG